MVSRFIEVGIFAIVVMVSLPLLMHMHLYRHWASIVALIACHKAPIVALVVMVSLPLMSRLLSRFCNGNCHSCHNGIGAIVIAQASPPLSS
jgi:hypothetical protein